MGRFARLAAVAAIAAATLAVVSATDDRDGRGHRGRVVKDAGRAAADVQDAFDRFNKLLGDPDNGNDPPRRRGRRSINWDADAVPFDMPGDFFNTNVPRGAVFKAKRGEFRVSNPPPVQRIVDNRFDSLNKRLALQLLVFSPARLFTPLRDNELEVHFEVPGRRGVRATTTGFGAIFADVDRERVTSLEFLDRHGRRLAKEFAPAQGGGLSFLGVVFDKPIVATVKMTLGDRKITDRDDRGGDVVVADDFVYGEPQRA
ncbi:hypothetical protein MMPV_006785 [Pyropia vietnamensis]